MEDGHGNFFGTTSEAIFKISKDGQLIFKIQTSDFNGRYPTALVFGGDGNLYGVCKDGESYGNVFRMTTSGEVTVIKSARPGGPREIEGMTSMIDGGDGYLYGTAATHAVDVNGESIYEGMVYRMSSSGKITHFAEIPRIQNTPWGPQPASLVKAGDGFFYGVTQSDGIADYGTVFRMSPDGTLVTLHHFEEAAGGHHPSSLIAGPDGALYGCTNPTYSVPQEESNQGTVFKISPNGSFETLVRFTGPDGAAPGEWPGGLLLTGDGTLYGTTREGGAHDHGTVFKIAPGGTFTNLHQFHSTPGVFTSTNSWQTAPIAAQTGKFEINFQIKPNAMYMNGVTGLCLGSASSYSNLACAIRLNDSGFFDVRDGGNYRTDVGAQHFYSTNSTYAIKMIVDIATRSYSVWINGDPVATNFAFRAEQANTTKLDNIAFRIETGSHTISEIDQRLSGRSPAGNLVQGSNGQIYGTTSSGQNGSGTFFRISSSGTFKELNHGAAGLEKDPQGGFILGSRDQNYDYRLDRANLDGELTTIIEPSQFSEGFTLTGNGTIYGISGRSIWRLVFPGKPSIYESESYPVTAFGSVLLQENFSARGSPTTIYIDYAESPTPLSSAGPFTAVRFDTRISGYLSFASGTTLAGLLPGKIYYYRFRAENIHGSTEGPVRSFVTSGPPRVLLGNADPVGAQMVQLHGSVNAFNSATTGSFEISESPNFTGEVRSAPIGVVNGSIQNPVSADVSGLKKGTVYFYRLVGSNALGTSTIGPSSFTTLSEPGVATLGAEFLSTTRARIHGIVTPKGAAVTARFEYRLKAAPGEAPAVPAQLGALSETGTQAATATLQNLIQGTTYEYRLVASTGSLIGEGDWKEFTLSILSGLDQSSPPPLDAPGGVLTVNLSPPGVGSWRLAGELEWRVSGSSATGLATGNRTIEFRPVPGRFHPAELPVFIDSTEPPLVIGGVDGEYLTPAVSPVGESSLQVILEPAAVRNAANAPRWHFSGDDAGQWRPSGGIRNQLIAGNYLIQCEGFGDWLPPAATVEILPGETGTRIVTLVYTRRSPENGTGQSPVSYATVMDDPSLPFGYVGQLRSPAGTASGFAVKAKVVATAGHAVWDDNTKAAVSDLQWLFQRDAGVHEPVPLEPRGYFLASGYAAERDKPNVAPGEGTPESQHHDYAALYFTQDLVARGGFSGFLASEGSTNEFLTANSPKILAGYSTDITNAADRGRMHATPFDPPLSFALQQVPGIIEGGSYGTYTTGAIHGRAGSSGGPLFALHQGQWFPAGIFLGGTTQTVVRAIDRDVVDLFGKAETRANGGGNSHDGGRAFTVVAGGTSDRGSLKVELLPANLGGAKWKLSDSAIENPTDYQRDRIMPGSYTITILPVPGYLKSDPESVTIAKNKLTTFTYTYRTSHQQWRYDHFGSFDGTGDSADGADPDHDGRSNLDEYTAGTDPGRADDFFRVLSYTRNSSGFRVTVAGKKGRTYLLESRGDLLPGTWTPHQTIGPLAADQPNLLLTAPLSADPRRFYRVRVAAP